MKHATRGVRSWRGWFGHKRSQRPRPRALQMQPLEERQLLAIDLAVQSLGSYQGQQLAVAYEIQNEAAPAFDLTLYTSSDGGTAESELYTLRVDAPGDLSVGTHQLYFTPDFVDPIEDYRLLVRLDSADEIAESSETNNTAVLDNGLFVTAGGVFGEAQQITLWLDNPGAGPLVIDRQSLLVPDGFSVELPKEGLVPAGGRERLNAGDVGTSTTCR